MSFDVDHELLAMYVAEMPERIEALRSTVASNDRESLKRLAHRLAGSAGSYGFPLLSLQSRRLEMRLAEGQSIEECAGDVTSIVRMCEQAIMELQ